MILTWLVTLGFFLAFALALGIAVVFGRRPIQGSCGGAGSTACLCSPEEQKQCKKKNLNMGSGSQV